MFFVYCSGSHFNSKYIFNILKQFRPTGTIALSKQKVSVVSAEWSRRNQKPYELIGDLDTLKARTDVVGVLYLMPKDDEHATILKWCAGLKIPLVEVYEKNGSFVLNVR